MQGNLAAVGSDPAAPPSPAAPDAAAPPAWLASDATWRAVRWEARARTAELGPDRLSYVELGEGEGAPVLFVHGLGGNWTAWLDNLLPVARERRVVAVDLPGFGKSPPSSDGTFVSGYARTIDRFCDAVGLERCVLAGSSLGGFVAAELTLRAPERVAALVLVDAVGIVPTWLEKTRAVNMMRGAELGAPFAPRFRRAIASRPKLRAMALKYTVADPTHLAADFVYMALPEAPDPGFGPAFTAVRKSWSADWCDRLSEIECPTLIVWGELDTLLPLRQGREYARRIRSSEFHVFEGAGHLPMVERPAQFNATLGAFLSRVGE